MQVDIIIPTMNNRTYLEPCVQSIMRWTTGVGYQVVVVNNGVRGSCDWLDHQLVNVMEAGKNRGWTGGLALALEYSTAEYVLFLNDDTLLLPGSFDWLTRLLRHLDDPRVGAVGPATNCAIGVQSIFVDAGPRVLPAAFLVGFCLLIRRATLDAVGGVDVSLPGGDDIDLSIRLRLYPSLLLVDRSVFVYHHGFITGTKIHGPAHREGGWNSRAYSAAVWRALERKHGHEGLKLIGWEGER